MVYTYVYSKDGTLTGYTNFILSHFNPEDFPAINGTVIREFRSEDPETCRYFDYRELPHSANPYKRKDVFWHVLAARLAFVVIFQVCFLLFIYHKQKSSAIRIRKEFQRVFLTDILGNFNRNRKSFCMLSATFKSFAY